MDPLTIVIALLTAGRVARAPRPRAGGQPDGSCDRAHGPLCHGRGTCGGRAREAAVAAREAAKAANLSANACIAMAKEVSQMVQQFMRDRPQPGPAG